jgi:hypothetical protein
MIQSINQSTNQPINQLTKQQTYHHAQLFAESILSRAQLSPNGISNTNSEKGHGKDHF